MKTTDYRMGISFMLLNFLLLSSCNQFNRKMKNDMEQFHCSVINIPIEQMSRFEGCVTDSLVNYSGEYRLIVFADSTECSPCAIKYLYSWEPIIDTLMENSCYRETIFIFAPPKADCSIVEAELKQKKFKFPTYLDKCNSFAKANKNIPSNRNMHTFLVDQSGKVVLVGNPLTNGNIRQLLYDYLKGKREYEQ